MDNTLYLDDGTEMELPTKRAVCHRCNGDGHHSNPSIDGNGITADEFRDDPEFMADYFAGRFDITCLNCKGNKVVDVVDPDALDDAHKALYAEQLENDRQYEDMCRAERRAGA